MDNNSEESIEILVNRICCWKMRFCSQEIPIPILLDILE